MDLLQAQRMDSNRNSAPCLHRYVHREQLDLRFWVWSALVAQLLQLLLLHTAPTCYYRHRNAICNANRLARLLEAVLRHWPMSGRPTSATAYQVNAVLLRHKSAWRPMAHLCLFEPLLAMVHSCFHIVPFKQHLVGGQRLACPSRARASSGWP